ncbi:hypothetical protein [Thermophilibacter immobilis]|uniref:Uncharacterized protein n=1 Tax=Thermophilibacter immobilis TaxID=2779519 RepID=A0A7S7M7I0_9ACTN|nr:hypothetical protein [Thermophilibacter immobilis]QOY60175.1 hypothetical protein INP52_07070 [Thermophilibacter immobilis]
METPEQILAYSALSKTARTRSGVCLHCNCNDFYLVPGTDKAICCACGLEGTISVADGAVEITYPEDQLHRVHDVLSGKELHGKDIAENEGRLAQMKKTDAYKARVAHYRDAIAPTAPSRA